MVKEFAGHTRGLACVQYTGNIIASGSNDHTIKIWDVDSGECIRTFIGHTDLVRTLSFDSRRLVSGSYDQSIKVWDMDTGKMLIDIKDAHKSWVFHVALDAGRIISASQVCIQLFRQFTRRIEPLVFGILQLMSII
jgi:F-box and WD-40 domain protein 1/11